MLYNLAHLPHLWREPHPDIVVENPSLPGLFADRRVSWFFEKQARNAIARDVPRENAAPQRLPANMLSGNAHLLAEHKTPAVTMANAIHAALRQNAVDSAHLVDRAALPETIQTLLPELSALRKVYAHHGQHLLRLLSPHEPIKNLKDAEICIGQLPRTERAIAEASYEEMQQMRRKAAKLVHALRRACMECTHIPLHYRNEQGTELHAHVPNIGNRLLYLLSYGDASLGLADEFKIPHVHGFIHVGYDIHSYMHRALFAPLLQHGGDAEALLNAFDAHLAKRMEKLDHALMTQYFPKLGTKDAELITIYTTHCHDALAALRAQAAPAPLPHITLQEPETTPAPACPLGHGGTAPQPHWCMRVLQSFDEPFIQANKGWLGR